MLPLKIGPSGSISLTSYCAAHVSRCISKFRNRPLDILVKLSAKKIYQEFMQQRRRIELSIGSACRKKKEHPDSLYSYEHRAAATGRSQLSCAGRSFFWGNGDRERLVRSISVHYPESMSLTSINANEICDHVFDELGSGKTSLGRCIDWSQDFKSGYQWPKQYYTKIAVTRPDKHADVKVPWELSRFHYYTTLGKAYWYTNDEKYAREFVELFTHWVRHNPARMTINWSCAMEVAIRLVNLVWGYHFFVRSPQFDEESKTVFLRSLISHAQFITENLEYFGELSDNHYAANVVGLAVLGVTFPEFRQAEKWKRLGLRGIFDQVLNQVHEDGVQFEGSINYHRLVLEMFASALILCKKNKIEIPAPVWQRLENMFDFVLHYLKPDGSAPQVGDTDNGRLQVLNVADLAGHRYLLSLGAALFERSDFKAAAGTFHEEAFWLLGEEGLKKFDSIKTGAPCIPSKGFTCGGFYFMRNNQLYMAVRCAANGRRGIGNHSHNDALSFELYAYGRTFIVDPGTYVYTADPESRNLFRSTAYHNTLVVDGEEINRIPDDLFRLMKDAAPVVHRWETTADADFLDVQHNGYERLREPVTHRRQFYFDKAENYWVIRDLVTGTGEHNLSWFFHFNAGIDLSVRGGLTLETLCPDGGNLLVRAQDGPAMTLQLEEGWVSPSYGIKSKAQIAKYACSVQLPVSVTFIMYPYMGLTGSFTVPNDVTARAEARWRALQ